MCLPRGFLEAQTQPGPSPPNPLLRETTMISIKKVLVPTDFSEHSEVAMRYGKEFAATFKASLHVLNVVEENAMVYAWASPEGAPISLANLRMEMENNARDQISRILTDDERRKYRAELVTIVGSPFVEIVRYAKTQDIDLIVLGTHGRGPIAHMLIGS